MVDRQYPNKSVEYFPIIEASWCKSGKQTNYPHGNTDGIFYFSA